MAVTTKPSGQRPTGGIVILRLALVMVFALALHAQPVGYGGPGVLSRGMKGAGQRAGESASIRPFASVTALYDGGTIGVGLDRNGNITNPGPLWGVEATLGAYGTKMWRRDRLGLSYNGGYRHYANNDFYNGSDHMLSLDYTRQIKRKHSILLRSTAGTSSRNLGGLFGIGLAGSVDSTFLGVPIFDIFDNRSYFADIQGMFTSQIGLRNSFSAGASGFAIRRQSRALVGMNGQRAFGDFSRRVGRYTAIGASYQYFHVDYPRVFGEADTHSLLITLARTIGRAWVIGIGAGAYKIDFAGIRLVQLDPVVAEILGTNTGREAFNTVNVAPAFQLNIIRQFRRSNLNLNYNRSANPGNGVLLLSRAESAIATYSYAASRKWTFAMSAGYMSMSGYGSFGGKFGSANAGIQTTYRFWDDMHFTGGVDVRRTTFQTSNFKRVGTRVFLGFVYSPGDFPVSFR